MQGEQTGLVRAATLRNSRSTNYHPELCNSMALDLSSVLPSNVSTAKNARELPEERYKLPEENKRVRRWGRDRKGDRGGEKKERVQVSAVTLGNWGGTGDKKKERWTMR